jgi:hypothetical protein
VVGTCDFRLRHPPPRTGEPSGVLWSPWAWTERVIETPRRLELIRPLIEQDWELYTEVMALVLSGADYQPLGPLGRLIRLPFPASITVVAKALVQQERLTGADRLPPPR